MPICQFASLPVCQSASPPISTEFGVRGGGEAGVTVRRVDSQSAVQTQNWANWTNWTNRGGPGLFIISWLPPPPSVLITLFTILPIRLDSLSISPITAAFVPYTALPKHITLAKHLKFSASRRRPSCRYLKSLSKSIDSPPPPPFPLKNPFQAAIMPGVRKSSPSPTLTYPASPEMRSSTTRTLSCWHASFRRSPPTR